MKPTSKMLNLLRLAAVVILNVKHSNKTYAVIARRERKLGMRIKWRMPGRKWFAMRTKWCLDSNVLKHKRYGLTC